MKAWCGFTAQFPALLLLGLAACAPVQTMSPEFRAQTLNGLRSGTINLDCGASCAWGWVNERERMRAFDAAGDWESLALRVAQVGYQKDLAYYYLGRAAEGLGYREAALAYYGDSYTLATGSQPGAQCRQVAGGCMGVDLLTVLPAKLKLNAGTAPSGVNRSSMKQGQNADAQSRETSRPAPLATPARVGSQESVLTQKPLSPITRNIVDNLTMQLGESENYTQSWNFHAGRAQIKGSDSGDGETSIYLRAYGDLNGDGVDDAVVLLNQELEGIPVPRTYLIAVLAAPGKPYATNSLPISRTVGGNVGVKSLKIRNGKIVLDAPFVGPNDSFANPSRHIVLTYVVKNGKLVRVPNY